MPPRSRKRTRSFREPRPSAKRTRPTKFQPSKPYLDLLSDELLLQILDRVIGGDCEADRACESKNDHRARESLNTLSSLALTSRHLYRVVTPVLYSVVSNRLGDMNKLAITCHQAPDVARNIRYVHWTASKESELGEAEQEGDLVPVQDVLAILLLKSSSLRFLDFSERSTWFSKGKFIHNGCPMWLEVFRAAALGKDHLSAGHFAHLKTVRIRMGKIKLEWICPVLQVRSLRTLMLEDAYAPGEFAVPENFAPRSSSVERLYIDHSYLDSRPAAQLLSLICALKYFSYVHDDACAREHPGWFRGANPEGNDPAIRLKYPVLAEALLAHKDSLEKLDINNDEDPENLILENEHETLHIGSLGDLTRVTFISINLLAFVDDRVPELSRVPVDISEFLPKGLKTLVLLNDCPDAQFGMRCVDMLADSSESNLPNLKEIRILLLYNGSTYNKEYRERVEGIFTESGVACEFESDDESEGNDEAIGEDERRGEGTEPSDPIDQSMMVLYDVDVE